MLELTSERAQMLTVALAEEYVRSIEPSDPESRELSDANAEE